MKILVPATSANLGPGFDSLGVALDLHNVFEVHRASISSIQINGEGANNIKLKVDNIFSRIFNQIYTEYGGNAEDKFKFCFNNQIPISRGLGSSSAVIIGAIYSAFMFLNKKIDADEILSLALRSEKHPDNITPTLVGGFCSAFLNDNKTKIIYKNKKVSSDILAVVVIPNKSTSTRLARNALPKHIPLSECVYSLSRSSAISAAFFSEDYELLRKASFDKLHQIRRMKSFPALLGVQKCALQSGAITSTLSGSGSTMLNICYKDDASNIAALLQDKFPKYSVKVLSFQNDGVKIIESV